MNAQTPPLRQKLKEMASEAMLDAAERCMIEHGYEQSTMQQIAAEAGCATGTFYLYFKSKEELLKAIVARHAKVVFSRVRHDFDAEREPLSRLKIGIRSFMGYANENRGFFRLFLTGVPMRHRHIQKHIAPDSWQEHQRQRTAEIDAIKEAQGRGEIRQDLPADYLQESMMALCLNNLEQFIDSETPPSVDEQVEMIWGLLFYGMAGKERKS